MKLDRHFFLAVMFSSLLPFLSGGCVKDGMSVQEGEATPIRILTTIEMGFSSGTGARAAGTVDEVGGSYTEGTDNGIEAEKKVTTIRVLAFDVVSGKCEVNILFGTQASSAENKFTLDGTTYLMDLEILSGYYEFILIANENSTWTTGLAGIQNKTSLQELGVLNGFNNGITSLTTLNTSPGIPMIGSAFLNIPFNPASTETNPQVVNPTIFLKRTLAKVEVNLTNLQADNTTVYPYAEKYAIKSIELQGANMEYNVLEGDTRSLTENFVPITNNFTHTFGTPFPNTTYPNPVFVAYVAERKSVSTIDGASKIVITAAKVGSEDVVYTIPLYQNADKTNADATQRTYNIFRNTLYRLNCVLNGTEMSFIEVFYSVNDWNVETKSLFMGYGYTVEVNGNNITVSNTMGACSPHEIELRIPDEQPVTVTFKDGTRSEIIDNVLTSGVIGTYELSGTLAPGPYLEILYNGVLVKTYTK